MHECSHLFSDNSFKSFSLDHNGGPAKRLDSISLVAKILRFSDLVALSCYVHFGLFLLDFPFLWYLVVH